MSTDLITYLYRISCVSSEDNRGYRKINIIIHALQNIFCYCHAFSVKIL